MAKKKINKYFKSNKYSLGGMADITNMLKKPTSGPQGTALNFGQTLSLGNFGGIANTAASTVSGLINPSGNSTTVGNIMQGVGSIASNIPGIGGITGAGVNMLGGIVNAAFGSNLNEEFISQTEDKIKKQAGYVSSATDNASLLGDWMSHTDLAHVSQDDVGSDGWFSDKAKDETARLNSDSDKANFLAWKSLGNTASNVDTNNDLLALAHYTANGGPIHIKKENRGKFTDYCGGEVTTACIQKGLHSSNPTTRKRANFARNARKWHEFGGWLNTHGGNFSSGVTYIGNGGTHEENPFEGVQMGVDPQGVPNLVEEGEVVYNDYVFSNRIKVPDNFKKKYKITGNTYAEAAKQKSKASEEMPNDPITKRGLEAFMSMLADSQEGERMRKEDNNKFDVGGFMDNIFGSIGGERPTYMRYAPIVGSAISTIGDIFRKPDYTDADAILDVDLTPSLVSATPVGQKLAYTPFDRDFYINKLNANAGASRKAVSNTSGGNRAAALAGILATDYNYGTQLGNLARQAEEYNQALKERVAGFNRQTDMFNSQQSLQAQSTNAQSRNSMKNLRLGQIETAAKFRQAIKDQEYARRSANMTSFLQGLGDMGWENEQANWLDRLAESGVLRMNTRGEYTGDTKKAKGGKIKNRRRYTYG